MSPEGSLRETPLPALVRENCRERQTVRIALKSGEKAGEVFIREGQVVHAACGELSGEAALYDMMALQDGTFQLDTDSPSPAQTITLPWAQLLIESARRSYLAAAPVVEADQDLEPQLEIEEPPDVSELFQSLIDIPGVIGAVETAADGAILNAELPEGAGEREAAVAVLIGGAADQIGEMMNLGRFERGVGSVGVRRVLVLKHGEGYVGLLLSDQASAASVSSAAGGILR
ncbi:MAG: DUF4388 domain-containing protein, partial [Rudaea sp.]